MAEPLDNVEDYLIVGVVAVTAYDGKEFLNGFSCKDFIFISSEETNVNLSFGNRQNQEIITKSV